MDMIHITKRFRDTSKGCLWRGRETVLTVWVFLAKVEVVSDTFDSFIYLFILSSKNTETAEKVFPDSEGSAVSVPRYGVCQSLQC